MMKMNLQLLMRRKKSPICGYMQIALPRHLSLKLKKGPAVVKALSLPRRERIKALDNLKKIGVFNYIQRRWRKKNQSISEKEQATTTMRYSFLLHAKEPLNFNDLKDDFKAVLNKMILDDVSSMAKSDAVILMIGSGMFNGQKCKSGKKHEVEKKVRQTMRQLSRLFIAFKESLGIPVDSSAMLNKNNICHLRSAIDKLCGDDEKCGLKVQLQNTIKGAAKMLQAHYLVEGDMKADQVRVFMAVLSLVEDEVFGGALYKIKQKRNKITQKPGNLPTNETVEQRTTYLRNLTSKEKLAYELPAEIYVDVRDAVCARLTMYNGRRGGEPARLFIYQWKEAIDGTWLCSETREQYQSAIKSGNRITIQEGKGNKQVPVFFPPAVVDAMNFFCDFAIRKHSDVADENEYIFASTKGSDNHVSLMACCKKANLTDKVNGTMNRHRVSTLIGSFGLSEAEQQLAFDHFGHSGDVNRNIYQVPQAERQPKSTGRYLELIDKGLDGALSATQIDTAISTHSDGTKIFPFFDFEYELRYFCSLQTENKLKENSSLSQLWTLIGFLTRYGNPGYKDRGYPTSDEMKLFGELHGVPLERIQTKIVNEGMKKRKRTQKNMKMMMCA
ncbi:uncharacterized protein LOC130661123 [Hydractinia symbiolongicarpus]|uniref:uncharacterized protein LOC130661123 n=1 Tax=Hydractinia symbiolongicarpus TaxID=13093 RepID=UPI00254DF0C9|nr:uncharacterized protein LOC130661123 [Hydractinia symbiolongicarpus]